jgi:hypothetical protein
VIPNSRSSTIRAGNIPLYVVEENNPMEIQIGLHAKPQY